MNSKPSTGRIKPIYIIILLLTLVSYDIICQETIFPNVPTRMFFQSSILSGNMEPPYQYRIMKPILGSLLQWVISIFEKDPFKVHTLSYQFIIFFVFLGIYSLFYLFLKLFYTEMICIIGLLMLQIIIPLGITSVWEDGDYYTLLFYLIGLNLIFRNKDYYLPLIIAIGVFNRDQIIFLLVFYIAYLISENKLFKKKSVIIILASCFLWILVYYGMRYKFGFKESVYTISHNTSTNYNAFGNIAVLWICMVSVYVILCIKSFRQSNKFFKLAFASLGIYVILFYFNGIMTQMAKFLPAFLILIPMSLQIFTNEFKGKSNNSKYNPKLQKFL
ncbi:MAG: hypothetical protein ABI840_09290 [bacterium]